jgi:hypothetical protein
MPAMPPGGLQGATEQLTEGLRQMMPTATIESAMIRVDRDVEVPLTLRQKAPESAQLMVDNGSRSVDRPRQAANGCGFNRSMQ